MKNKTGTTDKRLLGAIDHIDDRFIEEAAEKIKERPAGQLSGKPNKTKIFKQIALLAACLLLLGAAIPLATNLIGRLPDMLAGADSSEAETTQPPEAVLSDEYFTTGRASYTSSAWSGIEYEGAWIYVDRSGSAARILKYDPETRETSSVCLDVECSHSRKDCKLCTPSSWDISYIEAVGDWLVYECCSTVLVTKSDGGSAISLYNMKTGESRVIIEKTQNENLVRYADNIYVMDGKVYMVVNEIDVTDPQNKVQTEYIYSYDPATDELVFMFEKPEDMGFIGMTNKRFIFTGPRKSLAEPAGIWTTDYTGGNLKKEDILDFDTVRVCGTYAYETIPKRIDYAEEGYNLRVYDLETNTVFKIDVGFEMYECLVETGRLFFTTVTEDRTLQLYESDLRGENKKLIFESKDMSFSPVRAVGDHLIIKVAGSSIGYFTIDLKTDNPYAIPALKEFPEATPW